ncbi:MAG: sulfatase [Planctomycetes bacterium]|nr:sulfatase [Planctomycetota bacterium]
MARTPDPPSPPSSRARVGRALLLAVLLGSCAPEPAPVAPPAKARNVLIVLLDTLRADRLPTYGAARATAPGLEALAKDAFVFEDCQSAAPLTVASLLSLMTSLYPEVHGVQGEFNPGKMSEKVTTLAEVLSARGYATAAFTEGGYARPDFGLGQGFQVFPSTPGDDDPNVTHLLAKSRLPDNLARTLAWLREPREQPFFLFFHTYEIHAPYWTEEANVRRFRPAFDEAADHARVAGAIERWNRERAATREDALLLLQHLYQCPLAGLPALDDPDAFERRARELGVAPSDAVRCPPVVDLVRDLYDASIRTTDDALLELWRALDELGVADDTLVIVTSDHGEGLGDHGEMEHSNVLHEEALRVPLLVRVPGGSSAPRRLAGLVRSVDVAPTVLELLGLDVAGFAFQGRSRAPWLVGEAALEPARVAFSHARRVAPDQPPQYSVRDERWRLVHEPRTNRTWLYDRRADPGELVDVAREHPEEVQWLRGLLERQAEQDRWLRNRLAAAPGALELDGKALRELRALGYAGEDDDAAPGPSGRRSEEVRPPAGPR